MTSYVPDEVSLFLFSSAVHVPHRIHYDHAFAAQEGHPALVVHGTLQAAWLMERADAIATQRQARLTSFTYRNVEVALLGDRFEVEVTEQHTSGDGNVELTMLVRSERTGRPTTIATAVIGADPPAP